MATPHDVTRLAALARIKLSPEELDAFTKEFDAILAYVSQLESLALPRAEEAPALRNVMREDSEPHAGNMYTEKLAGEFPAREGDALVVKQVISHD